MADLHTKGRTLPPYLARIQAHTEAYNARIQAHAAAYTQRLQAHADAYARRVLLGRLVTILARWVVVL